MANHSSMIILALVVLATMSMLVHTRPLTNTTKTTATIITTSQSLMTRLKLDQGDGGSPGCWDALLELQACTGEIILFFLNGETYLGTGCCRAIEKIERQCWPSLMKSLGFTSEEGDILRGYCDVSGDASTTTPPPPTPPTPRRANTTTARNSTVWNHHGRF